MKDAIWPSILLSLALLPVSTCGAAPANCGDTVARALASPHKAVAGSYACLAPVEQLRLKQYNLTGDAALERVAGGTSWRFIGSLDDGSRVYEIDTAGGSEVVTMIFDSGGRVLSVIVAVA